VATNPSLVIPILKFRKTVNFPRPTCIQERGKKLLSFSSLSFVMGRAELKFR
jgi:hypothetical protein